ncbi:Yip1 family protein [Zhongshania arctica]|uniref:Yip1 family protein n=1 Tax=Zhongshania arctica TaxID=3238302 RepID=A0ABV3TV23_9GAMM
MATFTSNPLGFLFNTRAQWRAVGLLNDDELLTKLLYPVILAIGPCVAWYYGTSQIGWTVGDGETILMTKESALHINIAFYIAMLCSLAVIGYFIHWMAETYGSKSSFLKGTVVASYTATPLFFAGLIGFYPVFWVDLLIGIGSLGWAVYLLYVGIPEVMNIPKERGFLYASAVVGICMVIFMSLMGAVVILWDMGMAPVFIDA